MKKRKKMFTLLEILISLGLTVILLGALSFFYSELIKYDKAQKKIREESVQVRMAEKRLQMTIGKSISSNILKTDFLFYTGSYGDGLFLPGTPYLLFTYDRGLDRSGLFSNEVIGRLFVDNQKRLTLASWPLYSKWEPRQPLPIKKEVLLENVSALKFHFYIPQAKPCKKERPEGDAPAILRVVPVQEGKSGDEWRNEFGRIPAIATLFITIGEGEKAREEKIILPLVNFDKWILY